MLILGIDQNGVIEIAFFTLPVSSHLPSGSVTSNLTELADVIDLERNAVDVVPV